MIRIGKNIFTIDKIDIVFGIIVIMRISCQTNYLERAIKHLPVVTLDGRNITLENAQTEGASVQCYDGGANVIYADSRKVHVSFPAGINRNSPRDSLFNIYASKADWNNFCED